MSIRRPAVFFARDGILAARATVAARAGSTPEGLLLTRDAPAVVRDLNRLGYFCFAIAHEPDVGRGVMTRARLRRVHQRLLAELRRNRAVLHGVYVCTHDAAGGDSGACCLPAPGLLLRAAAEHDVDMRRSWLVGNETDQVAAGRRAGMGTVLVAAARDDGRAGDERPDRRVARLPAAVDLIRRHREASIREAMS